MARARLWTLPMACAAAWMLASSTSLAAPPEGEPTPTTAPAMAEPPATNPYDVSDEAYTELLGKQVNVQQLDGLYVYGELIGFNRLELTILGPDGYARKVARAQVYLVQYAVPAPAALPAPAVAAPDGKPAKRRKVVIDPQTHRTGTALVTVGFVSFGLGALMGVFIGPLVALEQWDSSYFVISFAGLGVAAAGVPFLVAGTVLRNKSKVYVSRGGHPRLQLGPAATGLELRF